MRFDGQFEIHLTLESANDPSESLRGLEARWPLKFVHIVLEQGQTPSQPMVTIQGSGTLAEQIAEANALAGEMRARGLIITRIKIEASPTNQDVPQTDPQASELPAALHFEHHIKLLLEREQLVGSLQTLVEQHAARLSRNARRARKDGRLERFVTQRIYGSGRMIAQDRLEKLVADLMKSGYKILDTEAEYVVFDSNHNLDAGWIEMA